MGVYRFRPTPSNSPFPKGEDFRGDFAPSPSGRTFGALLLLLQVGGLLGRFYPSPFEGNRRARFWILLLSLWQVGEVGPEYPSPKVGEVR